MTFQAKVWIGVVVVAAIGIGTYLFVEKSRPVKPKNLTNVNVSIDDKCTVYPKEVTIYVDKSQVHWQAGSSGATIKFHDSPFTDGSIFVTDSATKAVDSGLTNDEANDCANAAATSGKKCAYEYTVTVNGTQCTDPRVIVSK